MHLLMIPTLLLSILSLVAAGVEFTMASRSIPKAQHLAHRHTRMGPKNAINHFKNKQRLFVNQNPLARNGRNIVQNLNRMIGDIQTKVSDSFRVEYRDVNVNRVQIRREYAPDSFLTSVMP